MTKNIILVSALVLLFIIELLKPYKFQNRKLRHAGQNLGITLINALLIAVFLTPLIILSVNSNWGLFNKITLGLIPELIITILALDLLTYWLHRLYHINPFFWKFHRMHHSDTKMDVTTSTRFHIGEHIFSTIAKIALYAALSANLEAIIIYETLFLLNVFIHHSNITLSNRVDKIYRIFLTSPNMHKVHHSNKKKETNSNYTSLFSFWDRIFCSYKIIKNPRKITFGIKGLEKDQTITKMLFTPFK